MLLPGVSLTILAASTLLAVAPVFAQAESFLLGPGSSVGPSTKVKPKNCVTAADGSITCDTQLESSPATPKPDLSMSSSRINWRL